MKLTAKAAARAAKGYVQLRRKQRYDWFERRGTVSHTANLGSACVIVKWDDAKWGDSWPKGAIELVE